MSLQATTTGQSIVFDGTGPALTFQQGDYTSAFLFKRSSYVGGVGLWNTYQPDGFSQRSSGLSGGSLFYNGASDVAASNLVSGKWYWVALTRGDATGPARYHWAELTASGALSWTHVDGVGNNGPTNGSSLDRVTIGDPFGYGFQGDVAALALFGSDMTDAEIEATFARSAGLIDAADPLFFAVFPQASAANPAPDLAGGAGETSRTGGWTASADPAGFDMSLGPVNVPPTVDAGPDRTIFLGQSTTLTASATDTDGTVASYTWTKVSGPAATLTGTGASRTFTPADVGTYVFAATATDDDGATSAPDQVTVNVFLPPPPPAGSGIRSFDNLEQAVMALITGAGLVLRDGTELEVPEAQIGGDFGFDQETMPWYIRIDRVPGGSGDRHQADFIIDLEVFGADYLLTESVAYALEALVLGYPHVVEVGGRKMVLDDVTQNVGVADLPWEDDSTYRLGATYVITRRR